jgi:sulfur-carrier protein
MTIRLLYFAAIRELVGTDEESVDLPVEITTLGALRGWLERDRDTLRGRLGTVRLAKNEAFASDHEVLAHGDVVALIPPVAGG